MQEHLSTRRAWPDTRTTHIWWKKQSSGYLADRSCFGDTRTLNLSWKTLWLWTTDQTGYQSLAMETYSWLLPHWSFFFTNNAGQPHSDELGRMNPLSSNSFSWFFNSVSSLGGIRYGLLDIGVVPSINSIANSTSLSGEVLAIPQEKHQGTHRLLRSVVEEPRA